MTKLVLTDRYIKALKPGAGRIEITDAGCRNLVLRCAPSGLKTWNYAYSIPGTAATDNRPAEKPKMQRITLGEYPAISLETARELAGQRRAQRKAGLDAKAEHDRERVVLKQTAIAFGELCDLYVQHAKANGKLSWGTDEGYLSLARAKFRKRSAVSLTKVELVGFLENIRDGAQSIEWLRALVIRLRDAQRRKAEPLRKPRPTSRKTPKVAPSKSSANRTQSVLRTLLGWAVEKDHLPVNVLAGVKKVGGKENEKDRVLTADEIRVFLALLAAPEATVLPTIRQALQAILLTAQRPGEVAGMMLSELHDLDGERPHWIIPRLRTKNKKTEHTVPLSPTAVRLIGEALAISKNKRMRTASPKRTIRLSSPAGSRMSPACRAIH